MKFSILLLVPGENEETGEKQDVVVDAAVLLPMDIVTFYLPKMLQSQVKNPGSFIKIIPIEEEKDKGSKRLVFVRKLDRSQEQIALIRALAVGYGGEFLDIFDVSRMIFAFTDLRAGQEFYDKVPLPDKPR